MTRDDYKWFGKSGIYEIIFALVLKIRYNRYRYHFLLLMLNIKPIQLLIITIIYTKTLHDTVEPATRVQYFKVVREIGIRTQVTTDTA